MSTGSNSLVLASASPRRSELLSNMGCEFRVVSADIDEDRFAGEAVIEYVSRMAVAKANAVGAVLSTEGSQSVILAADTVVTQEEAVYGKPKDQQDAFEMWRKLAGKKHKVVTAVCLVSSGTSELRLVETIVEFGTIDENQMVRYWLTGEPQDKAGGYAIQGLASAWVKLINGSYSNVVGLPLRETNELLKKVNLNWL